MSRGNFFFAIFSAFLVMSCCVTSALALQSSPADFTTDLYALLQRHFQQCQHEVSKNEENHRTTTNNKHLNLLQCISSKVFKEMFGSGLDQAGSEEGNLMGEFLSWHMQQASTLSKTSSRGKKLTEEKSHFSKINKELIKQPFFDKMLEKLVSFLLHYSSSDLEGKMSEGQRASNAFSIKAYLRLLKSQYQEEADDSDVFEQDPYPWWTFIPQMMGHSRPNQASLSFETRCFKSIQFGTSLVKESNGEKTFQLVANSTGQKSLLCTDVFIIYGAGSLSIELLLWEEQNQKLKSIKPFHGMSFYEWDGETNGLRIFKLTDNLMGFLVSFLQTFALFFGPISTRRISFADQLNNALFMNEYSQIQPFFEPGFQQKRPESRQKGHNKLHEGQQKLKILPEIASGDIFAVTRLDGYGPVHNWLFGSNVAHLAVTVCNTSDPNRCFICEVQSQALWWPKNGVQCTEASQWLNQTAEGSMNVVYMKASEWTRAVMNASKAMDWIEKYIGVEYGYQHLFFGWVDTLKDNYPCFPNSFAGHCLAWDHFELFVVMVDNLGFSAGNGSFGYFFGGEAINHRANVSLLPTMQALQIAKEKYNLTAEELVTLPELDSYEYDGFRDGYIWKGPFFTSASFVCNVLRESGALGAPPPNSMFQCAEQTTYNMLALDIFSMEAPQQMVGDFSFTPGPDIGSRQLSRNMGDACGGNPPLYNRKPDC